MKELAMSTTRLPSDETRELLMLQAAKLYYELDKTQNDIARELGLTRWQVSRLIQEARDEGIVRIEILPRSQRRVHLESKLQKTFGLREAIIVHAPETNNDAMTLDSVAQAAGKFLTTINPPPPLVGVCWGRTMASVARWLPNAWAGDVEVVLVNGATTYRSTSFQSSFVAERFAQTATNGRATLLPVPAIVGKAATRRVLEDDPVIADVLQLGASAPIVCFSMGALSAGSVLVESGYLGLDDIERLTRAGAVGDILGRFIDAHGVVVDEELDERTIGLRPDALRDIPWSIGISSGRAKHAVALSCLKAGFIDVFVSDDATALYVLEHHDD